MAALAGHSDFDGVEVHEDPALAPFSLRFEWRAGVAEFDASAAAEAVMTILQGHADAANAAPEPEPLEEIEPDGADPEPPTASPAAAPPDPRPARKPSPLEQFDHPEGAAPNPLARS